MKGVMFFILARWVTFGSPLGHLWVTLGHLGSPWTAFGVTLDDPSNLVSRIFRGSGFCKLRDPLSIQWGSEGDPR